MDLIAVVFGVMGGLALFLYGLRTLSDGLKKIVGEKFRIILEKLTGNPLKGCLVGAFITASMQSSSLMMVIQIGLLNAGLLTLRQAIGIMLGGEIGTTITAQLIAFKIGIYYLPIIAFGFFLSFIAKDKKYRSIGQIILGFGLLYLGMNTMSSGVKPLESEPVFTNFLLSLGKIPAFGVIAGAIFTGIIGSSSATTGLVVSMGMSNLITLNAAIAIILGANIGTCIDSLYATIGSSISSKRLALTQLLINTIGTAMFFPFLTIFSGFIGTTSSSLPRQIANAHTVFNLTVTALMLPLTGLLVFIIERLLPGEEIKIDKGTKFINKKLLNAPSIALSQADKETIRMANIAYKMLDAGTKALLSGDQRMIRIVMENEEVVDKLHETIDRFLDDIPSEQLSEMEFKRLSCLKHSITDIERVGDHANNLVEIAENMLKERVAFSKTAVEELKEVSRKTKLAYGTAVTVLRDENKKLVQRVLDLEAEIDVLQKTYEANHVQRLKKKICSPVLGIIFVDILRNLERVGDHSNNIANSILLGF